MAKKTDTQDEAQVEATPTSTMYIVKFPIESIENKHGNEAWQPSDAPQDLSVIPAERLAKAVELGLIVPAEEAKAAK